MGAVRGAARSGVYLLRLADGADLPRVSAAGALYIGRSSNLAEREFDTHFASGKTGFSTLRRSLGALLVERLDLRAVPRAPGPSATNTRNYRFDDAGEDRLSTWMREHLLIGVASHPNPRGVEGELIALACPALNLTGWENPMRAEVKRLRKRCAEQAEAAR